MPDQKRPKKSAGSAPKDPGPDNNADQSPPAPDASRLFVVAIGASAGGLEALEGLFEAMPDDTGAAFVVIQHLDPEQKSFTPELLSKYTDMRMIAVDREMPLERDTIYFKTPQNDLSIVGGSLRLLDPISSDGRRLPIDRFFRDLAEDQGEKSVGIILSGAGSDGSLALKDIHRAGGSIFVQDPDQAGHTGMPRSAIDTDLVDFVLPVEQIPRELEFYLKHPLLKPTRKKTDQLLEKFNQELPKILRSLRSQTGQDFSRYKKSTVRRRIQRRMALQHIDSLHDYAQFLMANDEEAQALFRDLLINVTSFFRDAEVFEALKQALGAYLDQCDPEQELRIWCPGCATGEEAYSIAMLVHELFEEKSLDRPVRIFATDLNAKAIDAAREASYPENIAVDVGERRLRRYFKKKGSSYKVNPELREMLVFAIHNLTSAPPFSRVDLVSCRNLLIYLETSVQKQILPLIHYSLKPDGLLLLGKSEDIGEFNQLFTPIDKKLKLFRASKSDPERNMSEFNLVPRVLEGSLDRGPDKKKRPKGAENRPTDREGSAMPEGEGGDLAPRPKTSLQELRTMIEKTVLERYSPPGVLVDAEGTVRYFHGDCGRYLCLPRGEPSHQLQALASGTLLQQISEVLEESRRDKKRVVRRDVPTGTLDHSPVIDLVATPLVNKKSSGLVLLNFEEKADAEPDRRVDAQVAALERELMTTRQDLQATIEELESSNEELQSANEEMQANNEELQSSNEELETSREELQSTNEELEVVNAELEEKNQALVRANDDVSNLFNATQVGTVILDDRMRVKRFTTAMTRYFKLIESDLGRPLTDIVSTLKTDQLQQDCKQVLDTLEKQVREVQTTDGAWVQVSIHPYRSSDNVIAGVVVTCTDQSRIKHSEIEAQEAWHFAEAILETTHESLVVLDGTLTILKANRAFLGRFARSKQEVVGQQIDSIDSGVLDLPRLRGLLEKVIPEEQEVFDFDIDGDPPLLLNARKLVVEEDREIKILLSFRPGPPVDAADADATSRET